MRGVFSAGKASDALRVEERRHDALCLPMLENRFRSDRGRPKSSNTLRASAESLLFLELIPISCVGSKNYWLRTRATKSSTATRRRFFLSQVPVKVKRASGFRVISLAIIALLLLVPLIGKNHRRPAIPTPPPSASGPGFKRLGKQCNRIANLRALESRLPEYDAGRAARQGHKAAVPYFLPRMRQPSRQEGHFEPFGSSTHLLVCTV